MILSKKIHIAQLIGDIDGDGVYSVDEKFVRTLKFLPKVIIKNPNKIGVGKDYIEIQTTGDKPFHFLLDGNKLYLREAVYEMAGMSAVTYLTPLGESVVPMKEFYINENAIMDEDIGKWYNEDDKEIGEYAVGVDGIKQRRQIRKQLHKQILREHERLAKGVMRFANKTFDKNGECESCLLLNGELNKVTESANILTRGGFSTFNVFRVQALAMLIDRYDLQGNENISPIFDKIGKVNGKIDNYALNKYNNEHKVKTDKVNDIAQEKSNFGRFEFNEQTEKRRVEFDSQYAIHGVNVSPSLMSDDVDVSDNIWEKMSGKCIMQMGAHVVAVPEPRVQRESTKERNKHQSKKKVTQSQDMDIIVEDINSKEI